VSSKKEDPVFPATGHPRVPAFERTELDSKRFYTLMRSPDAIAGSRSLDRFVLQIRIFFEYRE
jgi:hypothetical protein